MIAFVRDDGGRSAAGFKGRARDCVARSISIASGRSYAEVYAALAEGNAPQRITARSGKSAGQRTARSGKSAGQRTARLGIDVKRQWFRRYMESLGFTWAATMQIGSGCRVHLRADELPSGRLAVQVSGHMCAVIDGVLHDTHDCSRDGTRCVYGIWTASPTRVHPRELAREGRLGLSRGEFLAAKITLAPAKIIG
jgi:hypothetical protein